MKNSVDADSNSTNELATLQKVLTEIGWEPQLEEKVAGFYVDFGPPHIPISDAFAAIAADTEQFVFYINFGPAAPPERSDEVARFITSANWGLTIGNFELDYSDGQVRFKSSLNFANAELSETLIRNAILSAMNAVEAYGDLLVEVMAGMKSADQAIEEARAKSK
jgi:Putative bacterial sensory transduction regulator